MEGVGTDRSGAARLDLSCEGDAARVERRETRVSEGGAVPGFRFAASGLQADPPCEDGPERDEKVLEAEQRRRKQAEVGAIPVPPKYRSADFLSNTYWRLRGALDVPKERFVSYPHCSRDTDPSLLVGWAGWDHLQQAQALAAYCLARKEQDGWSAERLTPLLAGLLELIPWVKQWHNAPDPQHGVRMGDYFEDFVAEEARELRLTPDQIRAWTPPAQGRRRKGGSKTATTGFTEST
jgi:hypothetical protein